VTSHCHHNQKYDQRIIMTYWVAWLLMIYLWYSECQNSYTTIIYNSLWLSSHITEIHVPKSIVWYGKPQKAQFEPRSWRGVLDTTLCDKVCQWLATGRWFSPGTQVSSTNRTDRHNITEILLKVTLNTINHHQKVLRLKNKIDGA
jgi:hypothetical protein